VIQDVGSRNYILLPSRFGPLVLLWAETGTEPRVERLLLPVDGEPTAEMVQILKVLNGTRSCPEMHRLASNVGRYLAGEDVTFPLEMLTLERCSDFQQRVLRAEHAIPRGRVSTYGRIACHVGMPGGARAVGTALANNPFPILIPCHRAVRSDGSVGGFRGGSAMKQALLAMEGVQVSPAGKVLTGEFYY
jgi:methylated-DNA-[protein]-cysteine S-methyltransferase